MEAKIKGRTIFIDEEDFHYLQEYTWFFSYNYIATNAIINNKKTNLLLHRLIMNCFDNTLQVHHKNFNKNDVRKENLIICMQKEHGKYHKWTAEYRKLRIEHLRKVREARENSDFNHIYFQDNPNIEKFIKI